MPRLADVLIATLALALLTSCQRQREGTELPDEPVAPVAAEPRPAKPGAGEAEPAPRPAKATDKAAREVRLTGTTEAHRSSTLTAKIPAPIKTVHVLEGQIVKQNDTLVTLDLSDLELQVEQARAALEVAKAGISGAQAAVRVAQAQVNAIAIEAKRAKALLKDKAIPKSQWQRASSQLSVAHAGVGRARAGVVQARAGLGQAKAAVAVAEQKLQDGEVKAPFEGVVVKRHASEGEYATSMPPKILVTLQETRILDLRVQVPSVEMRHVRVGTKVKVYFPDFDKRMDATITRLIPVVSPMTRSMSAIVELQNPDYTLRPGMFAEVTLTATAGEGAK